MKVSSSSFKLHLEGVFRVLSWLARGCKMLMPRVVFFYMGCDETRTPYGVAPEFYVESNNQAEGQISLESFGLYLPKI
jgi:hypothetical protein